MPLDPQQRDQATLADITGACRLIQDFIEGYDRDAFEEDAKTQSSVIHQLLIIGEAAKRLTPQTKKAHPEVPWQEVTGMRDRLIHGYHEIDLQEVWDTAVRDIPRLLHELEK